MTTVGAATRAPSRRGGRAGTLLRAVFVVRAMVGFAFVVLLTSGKHSGTEVERAFTLFMITDGSLAVLVALAAAATRWFRAAFVAVTLVGGLVFIAAGALLAAHPAISQLSLLLVLYLGILGSCMFIVGLFEVREARNLSRLFGASPFTLGIAVAGVVSLGYGTMTFFMPPLSGMARQITAWASGTHGLALAIAAMLPWRPFPKLTRR